MPIPNVGLFSMICYHAQDLSPIMPPPVPAAALPAAGAPAPVTPLRLALPVGHHDAYTTAHTRITPVVAPGAGGAAAPQNLGGAPAPGGDTIYLPYVGGGITSVRLPTPAPAGVTSFFTAGMDGCRVFVDNIPGSADLIVYHANAGVGHPAPNDYSDQQTAVAAAAMSAQIGAARGHYAAVLPAPGPTPWLSIAKPRYFRIAGNEERRKRAWLRGAPPGVPLGRTRPSFMVGTTFFAHYTGLWTFGYQAWGRNEYSRPLFAPARYNQGRNVVKPYGVLECVTLA